MFIVHKFPDTGRGHEDDAGIPPGRWPTGTRHRRPTRDEIAALDARARQIRAKALRDGISFIGRAGRRLVSLLGSFLASYGETLAARRAYDVLSRLSDHELADIGLTRGQIPGVIWHKSRRAQGRIGAPADEGVGQEYSKAA